MKPPPTANDVRAATVLESPPSLGPIVATSLRDRPQFTRPRADVRGPSERPPALDAAVAAAASAARGAGARRADAPATREATQTSTNGRRVAAVAIAFGAFVVILGVAVVGLRHALAPTVHARMRMISGDPVVELAFSRVDDGERVGCLGQRLVVRHGRVDVPIRSDTFSLGTNEFQVRVGEGANATTLHADVVIDRWASRDESVARADPPRLGVVVRAPAGTRVSIDDEDVALDAAGEGRWSVPIPSDAAPVERTVSIRWARGASVSVETLRLASSPARLELHQPPLEFVTDRSSLVIDATVAPTASVVLDGTPVAAVAGHVRTTIALPRVDEFRFRLDVLEPGRHRRTARFVLRRVDDLERAAASFVADPSIGYAEMAAHPERTGGLVDLSGRVFHIRVDAGRSIVQLLAAPCQLGAGCPLWVEYPAVTAARIGENVRVRGRFVGPQAYLGASGATESAPRIDAEYITVLAR